MNLVIFWFWRRKIPFVDNDIFNVVTDVFVYSNKGRLFRYNLNLKNGTEIANKACAKHFYGLVDYNLK